MTSLKVPTAGSAVRCRVLLLVQAGNARPKCVRSAKWSAAYAAFNYDPEAIFGDVLDAGDRWWLVECANAEDGRFVIECDREAGGVLRDHYASDGERIYGRILASGGPAPDHAASPWGRR